MLQLYNSLTKKKEKFIPRSGNVVRLYTCGPTVYAKPHIGNLRTYVIEDSLKRHLISSGFKVKHVMNITDIDRSMERAAKKAGRRMSYIARKYEKVFFKGIEALGVMLPDRLPKVSENSGKMIDLANRLLKMGAAYEDKKGRVFFDISRFPSYGKLVGKKIKGKGAVLREEYPPFQAGDFLLMSPQSAECKGKKKAYVPAWNIQCAALSRLFLGGKIDIQMGGRDNLFNHHENTRAIANFLCGCEYARFYLHVRHLILDGKKMSKSKGNVLYLEDLFSRGMNAKEARMLLVSAHYRRRLNFTWKLASMIKMRMSKLKESISKVKASNFEGWGGFEKFAQSSKEKFKACLDNDLDLPSSIVVAERFAEKCAGAGLSKSQSQKAMRILEDFDFVLKCLPI